MNKLIFVILTLTHSISFSCVHTDAVKNFIRFKIDAIVETNEVRIMTNEDLAKVQAYFEILDYVAAID